MPSLPISGLTAGDPAQSADLIPIDRSGSTFNVTAGSIASLSGSVTFGETLPGWWMCCDGSNYAFDGNAGGFSTGTANLIKWWMIRVPYTIVVKTMSFRYIGAGSGGVGGMAIYDKTGQTKLVSFDNFAFSGGAGPKTITNSVGGAVAVTLPAGIYIVACAQSTTGATASTQGGYHTEGSSDNTNGYNIVTPRSGQAANPMVAGVLPAALGTLTTTVGLGTTLPCCCFENDV